MKSNKDYVAESEQRKRDQGLTRVGVWVPNTDESKSKIKVYAEKLVKKFKPTR
jgi:ribosomal protein S16